MGYITNKTKERIDKLAHVIVLMERGEWEFPDGKMRYTRDENGNRVPRVVKSEAIRHVWGYFSNNLFTDLFSEKGRYRELLTQRLAFHRQRLDEGYRKALAELTTDGNALAVMSSKVYESLWWDLTDEETCRKIPFRDRVKFFEILTKMEASIKGDVITRGRERLSPQVVIQNISVPDEVKTRIIDRARAIESDTIEGEVDES